MNADVRWRLLRDFSDRRVHPDIDQLERDYYALQAERDSLLRVIDLIAAAGAPILPAALQLVTKETA